jgi:hypothetical protein
LFSRDPDRGNIKNDGIIIAGRRVRASIYFNLSPPLYHKEASVMQEKNVAVWYVLTQLRVGKECRLFHRHYPVLAHDLPCLE